jgi:5'-nucleotidase/UDP-sugar diphosphatase
VCNIVSKAWIRALKMEGRDVDLVINHAGLCQADIINGPVTKEEVDEFLPKGFKIVLVAMSGKDIELALQQGAKAAFNGNPKSYPYGSGIRFKVDYNRNKADGFVYDIEVKPGYVGGADSWLPLNSTQLYNVATNSKLADGGAGYDAFDAITNGKRILDYTDAELFAKYAEKECELDGAPYSTLKFDGLDTMLAQDVYQCLEDEGLCKCGFC